MFSSMNSHVSLEMLLPRELFSAVRTWKIKLNSRISRNLNISTWTVVGSLPSVATPVTEEMFLPGECLATVQTVVRSLRLDAHV